MRELEEIFRLLDKDGSGALLGKRSPWDFVLYLTLHRASFRHYACCSLQPTLKLYECNQINTDASLNMTTNYSTFSTSRRAAADVFRCVIVCLFMGVFS